MRKPQPTLDPKIMEKIDEICVKDLHEVKPHEVDFLRARRMYLSEEQIEVYGELIDPPTEDEEETTQQQDDPDAPSEDEELKALQAKCEELGINYRKNWKAGTLRTKIDEFLANS